MSKITNIKILQCILNIDMVCRSMYASSKDRIEFKTPPESVIFADSIRYSYIQLCSILDELKILNSFAKNDIYLKETLYIISPALRAIKKYNGIRPARNSMLAHFNRDKSGHFIPWWKTLKDLKLPRTKREIAQIFTYLNIINGIIVTRYYEQLKGFTNENKKDVDYYLETVVNQENNEIQNPSSFVEIESEIEKRMSEKGMDKIIVDPFMTEIIEMYRDK